MSCLVFGTVINDQKFKVRKILGENGFNRFSNIVPVIIRGNTNADFTGAHRASPNN